jgi:uncharacterized protein YjbJ (UPF0337 family)
MLLHAPWCRLSGAVTGIRVATDPDTAGGCAVTDRDQQQEGIKGTVEDIKGRVKETAGTFLGNDNMEREGAAQQDKADAQQQVAEKEAEARNAEQDAAAAEARERRSQ